MSSLVNYFLLLALVVFSLVGCGKSPEAGTPQPSTLNPQPSPVLRLHWLGKKRLSAEANATNFVSIWNMPESVHLETQTLDKLATAPWRLLKSATPLSNAPVALLRPLLDDLVQEESYLEIISSTNQPTEAVFAIKLPSDRAALWQTNLAIVLHSFSAQSQAPSPKPQDVVSSTVRLLNSEFRLSLSHSGSWTILCISDSRLQTQDFRLKNSITARIAATGSPYELTTTNNWINGDIDFAWLKRVCGWQSVADAALPRADFSAIGTGDAVRTSAKFTFPTKAPIEIEPWNIPTNLVHDPLIGFTTARGFRPMLKSLSLWNEAIFGATPNQITFWVQDGHPALRFSAFPSHQATNQMRLMADYMLNSVNPALSVFPNTTNLPVGSFESLPDGRGLRWRGFPFIMPRLELSGPETNEFITAGLFPNRVTNRLAPESLRDQFQNDPGLLLYDWEQTQPNTFALIQISQATRFIFGKNRLSITNNPTLPWLSAVSARLGNAGTSIRLASPDVLSFSRTSTLGLTGTELHLLTEWLESPDFPQGFFSLNPSKPPTTPP